MNSVSIYDKSWLDLVFEGKNKSYGAYRLRQENSRTTLFALLIGLALLGTAAGIPALINYFSVAETITALPIPDETVIRVSNILPNQPKPKTAVTPAVKKPVTDITGKKQLVDPEIVKPSEANQNIATNKENTNTTPTEASGSGITGNNPTPASTGTGTAIPTETNLPTSPVMTTALDKLPEFPGGIDKFYTYVGRNFERPELDAAQNIRVFVSFVIEKDGSMTDIRVLRDPGYGMGKEAIRVLKSLKTKWQPGLIGGQPVRTAYNLPITVRIE
jgi:outer membrane biosynthesis protein TonB